MREDRICALLEGMLSEAEEATLFAELARDARLRARFRSALWAHRILRERPQAPADFTERVMARLPLKSPKASPEGIGARLRRWWEEAWLPRPVLWRPAWAAAGILAIGLALFVGAFWPWRSAERPEARPEVLHRVRLAVPVGPAERVAVAGTFNNWSTEAWLLEDPDGDGIWTGEILLPPGRYEYMIVVDGERWMPDPAAPAFVEDGFGRRNALLVL
ncbi:MAG: hypothetical protein N2561_08695 [Bacteroidetes bacterium]|nr:hypothetical protein [Rhodothermia bacterium]MCS7155314.1 hypothetical protein [Bacteroidota bacterium]MCX7907593.1 hypothetical protein [Bacteroidota bacterium]MDW8138587.1 hypothetical protein [Bacteroidota bacterium]MDW8284476.1 hypothetical protein [Bacteroidota bacterium]